MLKSFMQKSDYSKIFEVNVKGKVSAIEVKKELIKQVTTHKKEELSIEKKNIEFFMKKIMGDSYVSYIERTKGEVVVHGPEDINTPLYRNGAGYKTEIENEKIKKLTVHYYYCDC